NWLVGLVRYTNCFAVSARVLPLKLGALHDPTWSTGLPPTTRLLPTVTLPFVRLSYPTWTFVLITVGEKYVKLSLITSPVAYSSPSSRMLADAGIVASVPLLNEALPSMRIFFSPPWPEPA